MDTNLFAQGFEAGTAWAQTAKHVAAGDLTAAREYARDSASAIEAAMEWENEHEPIPAPEPEDAPICSICKRDLRTCDHISEREYDGHMCFDMRARGVKPEPERPGVYVSAEVAAALDDVRKEWGLMARPQQICWEKDAGLLCAAVARLADLLTR